LVLLYDTMVYRGVSRAGRWFSWPAGSVLQPRQTGPKQPTSDLPRPEQGW